MKRTIISAFAVIAVCVSLSYGRETLSKVDFGMRLGMLTTTGFIYNLEPVNYGSDTVTYGNSIDYFGSSLTGTAFYFTRWRNNNIGYQIELMYFKKGGTEVFYGNPEAYNLIEVRYLEIPVLFKLGILHRIINAYAGGFISFRLDADPDYGVTQLSFSDMDFGAVIGVEFSYPFTSWLKGVLDVRYDLSLANALITQYVDIYSGAFVVSLGGALTF